MADNKTADFIEKYPDSLAAEYHKARPKRQHEGFRLLANLISNSTLAQRQDFTPPPPKSLVIHLRLGDVIDASAESLAELLYSQKYFFRSCSNETQQKGCYLPPLETSYNLPLEESWNQFVRPYPGSPLFRTSAMSPMLFSCSLRMRTMSYRTPVISAGAAVTLTP